MSRHLLIEVSDFTMHPFADVSPAAADKYHDMGTNDFLIGMIEQHERMVWML